MQYMEIDSDSNRIKLNAVQCQQVLDDALMKFSHYQGSLMWRRISGTDYLIHQVRRRQKSLGARSEETEAVYDGFNRRKVEISERVTSLKSNLQRQARLCKAVHLNRVPKIVADISRKIAEFPVLSKKTLIVGTNALYAYEAAAAVFFESSIVATQDVDVLWDPRHKISIASTEPSGFIGLLKSVDSSFEVMSHSPFRASNQQGFMVDLLQPTRKNMMLSSDASMSDFPDDLVAVEIKGLEWLVSCPKFAAWGIDDQGYPVKMIVPDPRAFVLHKFWLSNREDRYPDKKQRDLEQSLAVFNLIKEKLSYLEFNDSALQAMPLELRSKMDF